MGTETFERLGGLLRVLPTLVKLNNPQMGTETLGRYQGGNRG